MEGLKFKPELTRPQRQEIIEASDLAVGQIPEILAYERGPNTGQRGLASDLDFVFLFVSRSKHDLQSYREHPAHRAMVEKYRTWLANMVFVDWEVPRE